MTLKEQIKRLEKSIAEDFKAVQTEIHSVKKHFNGRLKPIEDYFIGQKAIEEAKKKGSISINQEVWNVVKWLILIIGGLVGVKLI